MTPKLLLKISAFLILFITVGHTIGHYTRKNTTIPAGKLVIRQMEEYQFNFNGSMRSWDNFYEGLSLDVSITLVVVTIILWMLANNAKSYPALVSNLLWPLMFCTAAFTVTGFLYFFIVPAVTTLIVSLLLFVTIMQLRKATNYNI